MLAAIPSHTSRFIFGEEPTRVLGLIERDPVMQVDRLTSAILDFPSGQSIFTCSTQLVPYQRMHFFGTKGRIEIEIPFNAPKDRPCRIFIDDGRDVFGSGITTETFPMCDQYTIQGDVFSRAVREGSRGSGYAGGCNQEYGGDRSYFPVRGIGTLGKAVSGPA